MSIIKEFRKMKNAKLILLMLCLCFMGQAYSQNRLIKAAGSSSKASSTVKQETTLKSVNRKTTGEKNKKSTVDKKSGCAATGCLEITGLLFANSDNRGTIIDDFGSTLYAGELKYLQAKIIYKGKVSAAKELKLYIKIVDEDGTLRTGKGSPEGYTTSSVVKVEPGAGRSSLLVGWGNNYGTSYAAGQYNYQIWYNGNILFEKKVRVYSGTAPVIKNRLFKINDIQFANSDVNGKILDDYGSVLKEGRLQYLQPKLVYEGLTLTEQKIVLMTRIFLVSGDLSSGSKSPVGFTQKMTVTIKPGSNAVSLIGWGNDAASLYKEGLHKYELWLDGEKIYETAFRVREKEEAEEDSSDEMTESDPAFAVNGMRIETTKVVDLGLKSGTKWAAWNVGGEKPEDYGGYYAWGESVVKSRYTWNNYFDAKSVKGEDYVLFRKYSPDGVRSIVGTTNDTARNLWGHHWQMPTKDQIDELLRDCVWTWTSYKNTNGFVVTGPNGKSIFMPAAGCYFLSNGKGRKVYSQGYTCYYWCGELDPSTFFKVNASCLIMSEDYHKYYDRNGSRCDGKSVRAVYVM